MRIIKTAEDRLRFIIDFANRKDLHNPKTFTDADLEILRKEFSQYWFPAPETDEASSVGLPEFQDFGGFLPLILKFNYKGKPIPEYFEEFQAKDFIELQAKIVDLLNEIIRITENRNSWAKERARLNWLTLDQGKLVKVGPLIKVLILSGIAVSGTTTDVILFILLMLFRQFPGRVLRCPNWGSRICMQKFFLKEGKSLYCSARCGNAYRVRQSLEKAKWRGKVQNMSKKKMSAEEISKRLGIGIQTVNSLLKDKMKRRTRSSPE